MLMIADYAILAGHIYTPKIGNYLGIPVDNMPHLQLQNKIKNPEMFSLIACLESCWD